MVTLVTNEADSKLVKTWNDNIKAAQNARMSYEKQWHQNLCFYNGRQWITTARNPVGDGFVLSEAPVGDKYRVRHTANRIKRIIRQELTKLSKEDPAFSTQPASTDESDRAAARAADGIAEFLLVNKNFSKIRTEATLWAVLCGTSFIKNWYDPNQLEQDGNPGKVDFEAVTAFHLFVPYLQLQDIQRQPWVSHAWCLSPEEVWNRYQVEVEGSTAASDTIMDSRFLQATGVNSNGANGKMVYLKETWVAPCKNFPQGAMFVITNDKLIYAYEAELPEQQMELPQSDSMDTMDKKPQQELSENSGPVEPNTPVEKTYDFSPIIQGRQFAYPYRHGRFPFAKIDHVPTGMFYADSDIKDLIPLQKEYNRTRSIMLETRNVASKPQYSYTKGAVNPAHYNSKPGLMLAVNVGFEAPQPLQQPEVPPSLTNDLEITKGDMDFNSGFSEVSQGKVPPGVEAASAISFLQEENDSLFFYTSQSLEGAVQETGKQILSNVHTYWDEDRLITITSRNNAYDVRKFKASSLKPMSDFRVVSGSMAPRSSTAKQAMIIELAKMGWVTPEQAMPYLKYNETDALYQHVSLDLNQAMRENMMMSDGQPINIKMVPAPVDPMMEGQMPLQGMPPQMVPKEEEIVDENLVPTGAMQVVTVNSFDNHQKHIEVHENYMKTQEWYLLPQEIKDAFEQHVEQHKMQIVKQMRYAEQGAIDESMPPGGAQEEPIEEAEVIQ